MNPNPDIDRLLVKCLLDEATAEEHRQVEEWSAKDPGNRQYFEDFRKVWVETGRLASETGAIGAQEAWDRFRQGPRFPAVKGGVVVPMHPRKSFLRRAAVAAVLILAAGGAGIGWYVGRSVPLLSLKTQAATLTDTLPDGSEVTLNKYSSLEYPRQFKGNTRAVSLEGEGFFHIAPNQRQAFQVRVNGVKILVLGTSFNVRAKDGRTEVIVETGKVEVVSGAQRADVNPGERVVVSGNHTELLKTTDVDELYQYYRTKQFVCRGTPLWKLADVLSEAYNVHIVIDGKDARNLPLTTTFRGESLDSILDVVTQTLALTESTDGQEIILK